MPREGLQGAWTRVVPQGVAAGQRRFVTDAARAHRRGILISDDWGTRMAANVSAGMPVAQSDAPLCFGPFQLFVSERRLTRDGGAVELGDRALDLLIALTSHGNEIISKQELLASVWPHATVEEGSLRFHMARLRKALGDGQDDARYIVTTVGRGYCFVAPISRPGGDAEPETEVLSAANLPGSLVRMVGRADDIAEISARLATAAVVTIVGAGGVGKTTVAVAVGHRLLESYAGAVLFVDLGMLGDPKLVATAVASMLGLSVRTDDAVPGLIAHLRRKRLLLILDTCEHLVGAVASLAARIGAGAPEVRILATSREALQIEGEQIYRLGPLAAPPDDPDLTAVAAQQFPAAQLFLERAEASGVHLEFSDADARIVGSICRKLDGVPLAIELAARRVEVYGIRQTAALLGQRLILPWPGLRTAPPRQRTLQATLDWSYELLSEPERLVLRRVAVFVGDFTLDAALSVATSASVGQSAVLAAMDSLVAKSMVAVKSADATLRYRLLDTTRAYALEVGLDRFELADVAARHAAYYRRWLGDMRVEWSSLSNAAERAPYVAGLNNVRVALEWSFGPDGDVATGVALAAAAAPVFLAMSLLAECHRWSERAILALEDGAVGGSEEMHLQAGLGMSLMFTRGQSEAAGAAFERSLAIAETHSDLSNQVQLLGLLALFNMRRGDFRSSLRYAKRCASIARSVGDPVAIASGHSILGASLYLVGDLEGARAQLESALRDERAALRTSRIYAGFDHHNRAGVTLARTLWFQGYPGAAVECVRASLEDAESIRHPVSLAMALQWAGSIFLANGDPGAAERHIDWFISHAESHSLAPYVAVGHGLRAELAILRGDPEAGIAGLRASLDELHAARYELITTEFSIALAQGLLMVGRIDECRSLVDRTIELVETGGDSCYMPELLRMRAAALLSMPVAETAAAKACLESSLEWSARQGAGAWALRSAVDLAGLLVAEGQPDRARALLHPACARQAGDLETADLRAARSLLQTLG
jgi:predicted ATPase/DNA-binding winged helix-turn-helix (wHTH) protein